MLFSPISGRLVKKFISIVLVALSLLTLVEIASWLAGAYFIKTHYEQEFSKYKLISPLSFRPQLSYEQYYNIISKSLPSPAGTKYTSNHPIVIFGCSFAYGLGLSENQTLSYKLAEKTHRPVYNYSYYGWGIQHMLWQLQHVPLNYTKAPEYVIYIFINDHLKRMYPLQKPLTNFMLYDRDYIPECLQYKKKDGSLVVSHQPFPFLRHSVFLNLINSLRGERIWGRLDQDKIYRGQAKELFTMYLSESKKIIKQKWPNAKVIVLNYEDWETSNFPERHSDFFDKSLFDDDFIYINSRQAFNVGSSQLEYRISKTDFHPNEHAWDVIVPQLAKLLE